MHIVTYNLHFGGKGLRHWGELITRLDPELMLVQESHPAVDHLPPLIYGDGHERAVWSAVEREAGEIAWGSGVYTKSYRPRSITVPDFGGWVVGAEIEEFRFLDGPPRRLRAFSLHAPSGRGAYAKVVNQILDRLSAFQGNGDLVIAGDFNLTVSPRLETETRRTEPADLKIQARLRDEFGLVNCWQHCNAGVSLAQTLRWSNEPEVPYHCDGIFVPRHWADRLRACTVLSGGVWNELSDHNPVVAEFA